MAWRCSGSSNRELIKNLYDSKIINDKRTYESFLAVDRAHFAPSSPYKDSPQSIGHGATISAPHVHASAADLLRDHLKPGCKVLDVGCGSGYLCAVFAQLVKPHGIVIGIDHLPELTKLASENLKKDSQHAQWLEDGTIKLITGDGRQGYQAEAPYDAIHVGAAAPVIPKALIEQLKTPGKMFIPVGTFDQSIYEAIKPFSNIKLTH
ncbi:Protein-L-isoaspartate O-methyltransferase [Neolecta irregularis DAH-3]|uniref:Protein-L-isoaspartate O-methyltransferase n=1 Tax=Neolecta irregularis (strain DAH-3) TaxID=1198029 RepID=A0A1U7LIT2_NEOID|nr:Protein-L-isoaspartate O-methyltransferase [Neolecta irregularis DAH-3]|eukprot:OLL22503.1 Protein-L-isoaspartate O-methyltransferase [Neolecta irregularis DAH-3]